MAVSKVVLGNETLVDLTSDTVSENTLLEGATAHAANGEQITGGVVVTPMYTGTKSAIESAIASGEIPDGAVVNITDDEETSSFQTQINEINNSLTWKSIKGMTVYPTALNTYATYQNDDLKGAKEVIISSGALGNLNIIAYNNSNANFSIKSSYYTSNAWNCCASLYFNPVNGEIGIIIYSKGSSDSFSDYKITNIAYR